MLNCCCGESHGLGWFLFLAAALDGQASHFEADFVFPLAGDSVKIYEVRS